MRNACDLCLAQQCAPVIRPLHLLNIPSTEKGTGAFLRGRHPLFNFSTPFVQAEIEKNTIYGTWQADAFIVGPDSSGEFCHMSEIK